MEFSERLEEKDKMRGLSSILSLFIIEFNKFNTTGARMLDMALDYIEIDFWNKKVKIVSLFTLRCS